MKTYIFTRKEKQKDLRVVERKKHSHDGKIESFYLMLRKTKRPKTSTTEKRKQWINNVQNNDNV